MLMKKSIRNTTPYDIVLNDVGQTIIANSTYELAPNDYLLWSASLEVEPLVLDGSFIVMFISTDLSAEDGLAYLRTGQEELSRTAKYDNAASGLVATNAQDAIDELALRSYSSGVTATFITDVGTQPLQLLRVIDVNTVIAIADNLAATIPNGIFGIGLSKPDELSIKVIFSGVIGGYSGFIVGQPIFVSDLGAPTQTVPLTGTVQQIGIATSDSEFFVKLMQPMRRFS
jgi:hypothetical protein